MAMALLAFAGFFRFQELANLKLKDLALHDTHFELFIESSKTDQYREGAIVLIVKSGTDPCPWGNLEKYLSQAKLTFPTSSQGGDDYLFDNIQTILVPIALFSSLSRRSLGTRIEGLWGHTIFQS